VSIIKYLLLSLFITQSTIAYAVKSEDNLPLYEWGVLGATATVPDYPASDKIRQRTLVFPTFIYRGPVLRNDREGGLTARLLRSTTYRFDFSFGASFAASSSDNEARKGMDDLDWIGEMGPRLTIFLHESAKYGKLQLKIPLRFVFSTDFKNTTHRGYRFAPGLTYRVRRFTHKTISTHISAYANFGTEKLNDYFYKVDGKFATTKRSQYNANAGYIGTDFFAGLLFSQKNYRVFGGIEYSVYDNSSNKDSPLFKTNRTTTLFLGTTWNLYRSKVIGFK